MKVNEALRFYFSKVFEPNRKNHAKNDAKTLHKHAQTMQNMGLKPERSRSHHSHKRRSSSHRLGGLVSASGSRTFARPLGVCVLLWWEETQRDGPWSPEFHRPVSTAKHTDCRKETLATRTSMKKPVWNPVLKWKSSWFQWLRSRRPQGANAFASLGCSCLAGKRVFGVGEMWWLVGKGV